MLRLEIALRGSLLAVPLTGSPTASAQDFPCEQPAYGHSHATAAKAGMVGAGGHHPGREHRGFSSCLRP
jgi:hypothetical protein